MTSLETAIREKTAKVGVVGLGYVGLPLIRAFVAAGYRTLGFDVDQTKVARLKAGESYIKHIPAAWIRECLTGGRFEPTADLRRLAEADAVLVFDPSAFAKKGTASVGVQRQWCGRLGKVDNCQVGIYLGYAARREHALVDVRLYLPR